MSSGFVSRRLQNVRFDVAAAVLGLLIALLLFPLRFLSSQIYIRTIPLVLGGACLTYLYATRRETRGGRDWPALSTSVHRTLPILVFVGLSALVLIAAETGGRSPLFLDLAGVTGTVLFVQIAFVRPETFDRRRILVQIVLLVAVVRFAALYATPGLIGIDIWTHITQLAEPIQETGSLSAIEGNKHFTSPLYHLLVAATSLLGDVPPRLGLYLSLGIVMPLSVLVVYAAGNLLVDQRWAAMGALVYGLSDYVIEWGIHLIPTSMGIALFLAVVYWLIRVMRSDGGSLPFAMLLGTSVAVILTHQVSTFIMMTLLSAALVAYLIFQLDIFGTSKADPHVFRQSGPVNVAGLIVFDAGLVTLLWSVTPYNDGRFLTSILSYLLETVARSASFLDLASQNSAESASAGGGGTTTLLETVLPYVNKGGFLLLLFIGFVGCLYVIHRRRARQTTFTLLIAAALMMVFSLGLPIFGIRNFIPQRWFAFLYAPLVLLGIIGFRYLTSSVGTKLIVAIVVVFAAVFPTMMLISMNGTIDNPVLEDQESALSFSEAEIQAVETIGNVTGSPTGMGIRPDQVLFTDHPYSSVFSRTGAYPTDTAVINDSERSPHDIVVYRTKQSQEATYFTNSEDVGEIRNIPKSRICRPSMAEIYSNDKVTMCVESSATAT